MEESFVENQKHQRAAQPVCRFNANMAKHVSFA